MTATIHLSGLNALSNAPDGVWYLRVDGPEGWIGAATTAGPGHEAKAGPAPIAVSASADAVYVLEGQPTFTDTGGRTNVLERLDPKTLHVLTAARVPGLGSDMAAGADMLWVVTTQGQLLGYDEATLARSVSEQLPGRGEAHLAVVGGVIWVLTEQVSGTETATLLAQYVVATKALSTAQIKEKAALAVSAGPTGTWVATGSDSPGSGLLFPFRADNFGPALNVPAVVAMADGPGGLWWASADGMVGLSNGQVGSVGTTIRAGTGASDLTISDGAIWVAADTLVAMRPE